MDLNFWLPFLIILGCVVLAALFAFVAFCDRV